VYANPRQADDLIAVSPSAAAVNLYHTNNGGVTWTNAPCRGVQDGLAGVGDALLYSPTKRLYIVRDSGLWTADEDGSNCHPAAVQPLPPNNIFSIAQTGHNPTALLVSGLSAKGVPVVMRSVDDGASYRPVKALPGIPHLSPWVVSSSPDLRIGIAVFNGSKVAVSRDGGATWSKEPDVLFPVTTGFSYVSATDKKVFLGDYNGPIFTAPYVTLH